MTQTLKILLILRYSLHWSQGSLFIVAQVQLITFEQLQIRNNETEISKLFHAWATAATVGGKEWSDPASQK